MPYDEIAAEYYDRSHLTRMNLDATTLYALRKLEWSLPPQGFVLEVGAGRGRSRHFLRLPPERVVQLDDSPMMLSIGGRESCALRVLHSAEDLPFVDGQFVGIAAFMCDAFLGLNFLKEARRVLTRDGVLIGTTPSYEWRALLAESGEAHAWRYERRFVRRDGRSVAVPSNCVPVAQLQQMLLHSGFSSIDIQRWRLPEGEDQVSEDIRSAAQEAGVRSPYGLDILYTIIASRD